MRFSLLVSSGVVLLASLVAADASDVLSLTSENFDAVVKPEPLVLVEFFAPWYASAVGGWFVSNQCVGVDTARRWPPTMRRPRLPSRRRA